MDEENTGRVLGWAGGVGGRNPSFSFGQVELEVFEIPGEISRGQLGMRIAGVVRLDMHL